jgi:predicted nucleotidyltransferase
MSGEVEQIISEFRDRIQAEYGDRLVKLVVFGSEARGDAEPDSDIDLLVVLKGPVELGKEVNRLGQIRSEFCLEYGRVISCIFMDEQRFNSSDSPLLRNVRREGVAV